MKHRLGIVLLFMLFFAACSNRPKTDETAAVDSTALRFTVLTVLPHDQEAFTEGLVFHNDKILESTGQNGTSWIAEVDPSTGVRAKKTILPQEYFGEGITVINNKIYHLTYTTRVGFVYDAGTYKKLREFTFDPKIKQGWGLTHDSRNLIVSDGTDKLHFLDTTELKVVKSISVTDGNGTFKNINELEYIDGYIFANVWETNWILKIDPQTGKVVAKLDLSSISDKIRKMYPESDVLNGIAYDRKSKALLVTGKLWPEYYLIRIQ